MLNVEKPAGNGVDQHLWHLLWSHAVYQVLAALVDPSPLQLANGSYWWGVCDPANPRRALLLHPSAHGQQTGELAVTVLGEATTVIARNGLGYVEYLDAVTARVRSLMTPLFGIPA